MRHKVTSYLNQLSEKVNQRSEAILTQHSVKFEKKRNVSKDPEGTANLSAPSLMINMTFKYILEKKICISDSVG